MELVSDEAARKNQPLAYAMVLGLFLVFFGPLVYGYWQQWHGLQMCDRAIQSTLKAPSTYVRISADRNALGDGYRISYDAQNSFSVPMRGQGDCHMIGADGSASWQEDVASTPSAS